MTRRLRIPDHLQDLITHLAPEIKKRIRDCLEEIRRNPESGKSLTENLKGLKSYKAGQFRIIYRAGDPVELVGLGPRKTIYQKMALEIKRAKD